MSCSSQTGCLWSCLLLIGADALQSTQWLNWQYIHAFKTTITMQQLRIIYTITFAAGSIRLTAVWRMRQWRIQNMTGIHLPLTSASIADRLNFSHIQNSNVGNCRQNGLLHSVFGGHRPKPHEGLCPRTPWGSSLDFHHSLPTISGSIHPFTVLPAKPSFVFRVLNYR